MNANHSRGWHCLNLGDAMLADPALERVQERFRAALASGAGDGMALFMRHESAGQLHCEVKVYFSPAAAELAVKAGASGCRKPVKYGLSLLAGDPGVWAEIEAEA